MKNYFKKIWFENPKVRKTAGVILVVIGVISVITPFTPLGFLLILGLEILGVRALFWESIKKFFKRQ